MKKKAFLLTTFLTLAILIVAACFTLTAEAETVTEETEDLFILGDVDESLEIDSRDYFLLKRFVLVSMTLTDAQQRRADVNESGEIDALDYLLLKRYCLGTYFIRQPKHEHRYDADGWCILCKQHRPTEGLTYSRADIMITWYQGDQIIDITYWPGMSPSYNARVPNTFTGTEVYFPDEYEGLPVVGVGVDSSDYMKTHLQSIYVPNGVEAIGSCNDLIALRSVTLSEGLKTIGEGAFSGCTAIQSLKLPNSLERIEGSAFSGCTGLRSINLPDNLEIIKEYAFDGCTALTDITIPERVREVGTGAFNGCTALKSVRINARVLGCNVFEGCDHLEKVSFGRTFLKGHQQTFYECASIQEVYIEDWKTWCESDLYLGQYEHELKLYYRGELAVDIRIPSDVSFVNYQTFANLSFLRSIVFEEGVVSIEGFRDCQNLESVTLPDSVQYISAFNGCTSLKRVVFPDGIASISGFNDCSNLKEIILPDHPIEITSFNGSAYARDQKNWSNGALYCGRHLLQTNESISKNYTVRAGTLSVSYGAFAGNKTIESVTLPEGITVLTGFGHCERLKTIVLPSTITTIDYDACCECPNLSSIVIPDSVETIGSYAFFHCPSLSNITIGQGIKSVGICAFFDTGYYNDPKNWSNGFLYLGTCLIEVKPDHIGVCTVKAGTTVLADMAFYDCGKLTEIRLPSSLKAIGVQSFQNCSSLTVVKGLDNVEQIGEYAFCACTSLTIISLPQNLRDIPAGCFNDCSSLKTVTFGDSILTIGDDAFSGTKLSGTYTFKSIRSIGNKAFYGCPLTEVTLGNDLKRIGESAFEGNSNTNPIERIVFANPDGWYSFYMTEIGFYGPRFTISFRDPAEAASLLSWVTLESFYAWYPFYHD